MAKKIEKIEKDFASKLLQLEKLLAGQKRLLIVLHNNPDPDALASALALKYLAQKQNDIKVSIAYGGIIGRAENRAMVRELKIPLKNVNRIRFERYNRIALVDTQPGATNNSLPAHVHCHIVIDHHPRQRGQQCDFVMIDPQMGATATFFIEWLDIAGLTIPQNLATALSYAIRSETQDLGREITKRDIQAYLSVYPKASMRTLARITHPKLSRSYFIYLNRTLRQSKSFRNLICAHLGEVPTPELVAEMADLLLRHKRTSWSFCSGRFKDDLYISLRSSNQNANAGKIIKNLVPNRKNAGGHGMFAGGKIELLNKRQDDIITIESKLSADFARLMGYENVEWKSILDES